MGNRVRTVWLCGVGLVLSVLVAPAGAQNFFAGAEHNTGYVNYGQTGDRGFFGRYGIDNSSLPGSYSSFNGWVGNYRTETGELVSGANVAFSATNIEVNSEGGIEWAKIRGRYKIQPYVASSTQGAYVAMSPGELSLWSIFVNPTPNLAISWGKKGFKQAAGLQFDTGRSKEYFVVERGMPVPNLLCRLVNLGLLPRRAMSWFNPERRPTYTKNTDEKPADQTDLYKSGTKYGGYREPDDLVHGHIVVDKDGKKQITPPFDGFMDNSDEPTGRPERLTCEEEQEQEKAQAEEDYLEKSRFAWGYLDPGQVTIGLGFSPWRSFRDHSVFKDPNRAPIFLVPRSVDSPANKYDLSLAPTGDWLAYLAYSSQDLSLDVGGTYVSAFLGPELVPAPTVRADTPATEFSVTEGWLGLQYANGWLRLNSEADWYYRTVRYQRSQSGNFATADGTLPEFYGDGSGRSVFAPQYVQSWRFMAEGAVDIAPWPFSVGLFYCYMPGPDRRHGIFIDRQSYIRNTSQAATSLFLPYSMLFAPRYGSGWDCGGDLGGSSAYALKLDYALAANLVFQGTVLHARRSSKSFGMGFIRPTRGGQVDYNLDIDNNAFRRPAPSIPDDDLGWELTAGVVWKLLDQWSVQGKMAYWQPGKWFNYACIDRSVPNWDNPSAANSWGIYPNRKIDPVFGFEIQFSTSY